MKRFLAIIATGFFIAILVVPPQHVRAYPVEDLITEIETTFSAAKDFITSENSISQNTKEFVLDPIAWSVAKMAIQSMTKSLVNWINSGFNGSPAFVTDLEGHLQNVGDAVAGPFIGQLGSNASLRSPFQSIVAHAVGSQYYLNSSKDGFFTSAAYTLNQVTPNDQAFLGGDFRQGGIPAWFSAWSNPANNPYGAKMLADEELARRVSNAQQTAVVELNWGRGFLSWCGSGSSAPPANSSGGTGPVNITPQVNPATVCITSDGKSGTVQTPGSVLADLTSKTLGLSGDQLVTADEFNEIIGALMSQLTDQVVGTAGLSGVSSVSSGGNGFIDQAANPNQYSGTSAGTSSTFSQAIAAQTQSLQQYQADWKTIGDQAQLAVSAASGCSSAASVVSQAQAANTKATTGLALLQKIQADATAAGSDQTKLATATTELQQALASSAIPSASDTAYAHTQVQNLPGTLFSKMSGIATTGTCS